MRTALHQLLERAIDPVYHSGGMTNTGMARRGFAKDKTPAILESLKRLYDKPSLQELDQVLIRLYEPMYRNQPVEVMLQTTEEFQMSLMAHPDVDF